MVTANGARGWRPEGWSSENIARENMPSFKWGTQEYSQVIRGIDIGADAMLEAIFGVNATHMSGFAISQSIETLKHIKED